MLEDSERLPAATGLEKIEKSVNLLTWFGDLRTFMDKSMPMMGNMNGNDFGRG